MFEIFENLVYWHWFIIGMVLLAMEAFGVGGFLVGIGIAAIVQGIIGFVVSDMTWQVQLVTFGVLSVVFSFVYWKYFRKVNEKSDRPAINDRAKQMIGKTAKVVAENKIQIGDVMWDCRCNVELSVGESVTVTDNKGMTLIVTK